MQVGPYISFTFLYFTTLPVMYFIILCTYLFMSLLNKHKTNNNQRLIVILTNICQKAFSASSLSVSNNSTPIVSAKYEIALILTTQELPGGNTFFSQFNTCHISTSTEILHFTLSYVILCSLTIYIKIIFVRCTEYNIVLNFNNIVLY